MGWVKIENLKTGKSELLGEPEHSRKAPPEELGKAVFNKWKKLHPHNSHFKESEK